MKKNKLEGQSHENQNISSDTQQRFYADANSKAKIELHKESFDIALRKQRWNLIPKEKYAIPSSENSLVNAARAIAVAAYPHPMHHKKNGKAERYSIALLAYICRVAKLLGNLDTLPPWAAKLKASSMQSLLDTGLRNLYRSFTVRELINSALIMKHQNECRMRGEKVTFTMNFRPDLSGVNLEIPLQKTVEGYILAGKIPDTRLASLRAAILYHRPALEKHVAPAKTAYGHDSEHDYQNYYNRYIRPALFSQHITQFVWESAQNYAEESVQRNIAIDHILMRKAEWARDICLKTNKYLPIYIFATKELGVPCCWCEMVRFAEPVADS